jgi:hypothetical protein
MNTFVKREKDVINNSTKIGGRGRLSVLKVIFRKVEIHHAFIQVRNKRQSGIYTNVVLHCKIDL